MIILKKKEAPFQLMDNCFITGQFSSSFSTTIIGKLEKPEINLRDIDLRGRKVLLEADFFFIRALSIKGRINHEGQVYHKRGNRPKNRFI